MPQTAIFGPFFATTFLTLFVWVYIYIRRIALYQEQQHQPQGSSRPWCSRPALASRSIQSFG